VGSTPTRLRQLDQPVAKMASFPRIGKEANFPRWPNSVSLWYLCVWLLWGAKGGIFKPSQLFLSLEISSGPAVGNS